METETLYRNTTVVDHPLIRHKLSLMRRGARFAAADEPGPDEAQVQKKETHKERAECDLRPFVRLRVCGS